ncbi:hypothetical protein Hanom_Chr12g01154121 [Helianthus anomalus]
MPVSIRDSVGFDKVGSLFGKVVWPSDFSWSGVDNSFGLAHVLTQMSARIDEEVTMFWRGTEYNVWVVEEQSTWITEFDDVNVNDNVDDMEEGEIRDGVQENIDGSGEVNASPKSQAHIM